MGRWVFRVVLALPLALAIGFLPYRAYGPTGIGQVRRLQVELTKIRDDNSRLREDNVTLQRRIARLKDRRSAIERVARNELGLVRSTDLVFLFE